MPLEQFQEPRIKYVNRNDYPVREIGESGEGWVNLGFMVDTDGKPFEITVLASTGNKTFEQEAARTLAHATFEPGTVNGKPTESASELKFVYRLNGGEPGARVPFVQTYRKLLKAIDRNERTTADAAMGELKITNLYEDAFYGLARYRYALKWGTKVEQLAGLRRAIAYEENAQYLSIDAFRAALATSFALEVETQRYGEALNTWHTLEKMRLDAERKAQLMRVVQKLKAFQADERAYSISDVMPEGSWSLELFKRHFRVQVGEGHVTLIKLYCSKRYVSFVFDPSLEYEVKTGSGNCRMEMLGDPGTKFTVSQF